MRFRENRTKTKERKENSDSASNTDRGRAEKTKSKLILYIYTQMIYMNDYDPRNKNEYNHGEWSLDPNSKKGHRNCRNTVEN